MAKKGTTKTISGNTLIGEPRTYKFNLLKYKDGVRLQHKYASIAVTAYQHFKDIFQAQVDSAEDKDADKKATDTPQKGASDFLAVITQILNWERTEELATKLLAGCEISGEHNLESHEEEEEVGGKTVKKKIVDKSESFSDTADDEGFCELFGADFVEMYTAIFYAAIANYPKYLLPFLDTDDSDSTPDS